MRKSAMFTLEVLPLGFLGFHQCVLSPRCATRLSRSPRGPHSSFSSRGLLFPFVGKALVTYRATAFPRLWTGSPYMAWAGGGWGQQHTSLQSVLPSSLPAVYHSLYYVISLVKVLPLQDGSPCLSLSSSVPLTSSLLPPRRG